uniref:NADH dehydrogenase subunit 2 n=1 Tax=Chalcophora japonica TaxID=2818490 RepID=UPI002000BD21|nr:NADH dehydrogenase subunit 2 [Chalcophora japonica]UNQ87644.1 NADH dehydrogenase subunit 2 [Chalcophora japonica]
MNFYKALFFLTLTGGTLVSISSNSWLGMWIGLEINLLSIIPLMNNSKNIFSSEASLKYFVTQVLASSILLFAVISMILGTGSPFALFMDQPAMMILNSALFTKMGAAPFHFWFPEVIEGLNWNNATILLTWQKIAPMTIIMYTSSTIVFIIVSILFSMAVSGILGLNQTSLRKILAYSSINHIGWMLASMLFIETAWIHYFAIYSLITLNITFMLKKFNIFYANQMTGLLSSNPMIKLLFAMNFLSLGGLPPFLGFLPKWMVIQNMISLGLTTTTVTMIIMTILTIYFYLRLIFSSTLLTNTELNIIASNSSMNWFTLITMNFLALTSLIFCTLIFNWI